MEVEILSPGVEHTEQAEFDAEAMGIGGNAEEGLGCGVEQDSVEGFFVIEGEAGDGLGHSEDHVKIGNGQQFGFSLREPLFARQSLALGTVPVAA